MTTAATMTASRDPSLPSKDGHCPWNKLSAELKDMIYDIAYVPEGKFRPFTKSGWDAIEKSRKIREKSRFVPGTFEPYFVERLLVSREWCADALEYFFRHTHFDLENDLRVYDFSYSEVYMQKITAVALRLDYPRRDLGALHTCPHLKKLDIHLDPFFFEKTLEKDISIDEWIKDDFDNYEESHNLLELMRGVSTVNITSSCDTYHLLSTQSQSIFEANIEVFKQLAGQRSNQPRPKPVSPSPSPQYFPTSPPVAPTSPRYAPAPMSPPNLSKSPQYGYTPMSPRYSYDSSSLRYVYVPKSGFILTTGIPLEDDEIPDDESEFQAFMATRGADLLEWIKAAKQERRFKGQ